MADDAEQVEDADEPLQRGRLDETTDDPELAALLEQVQVEMREPRISSGAPLS